MKILKTLQKIPGGLMIVPLLLGALVNTLFPEALNIGGFTTGMFKTGTAAILGVFLFCNGAQINVKQAGEPLAKGVVLTLVKFAVGALIGLVINWTVGPVGILGIIPATFIAAITNSNGGLFSALARQFGNSNDVGAVSILSINDGPFLTMVALGTTGIAEIPFMALVATIVPIILGFILGNLDEDLRAFLAPGTSLLIPFFAFPLGAALNFGQLAQAGIPGIFLGLLCVFASGIAGYFSYRVMKWKHPQVGAAIGTTAGNAAGTPAALATVGAITAEAAGIATAQIAAAIIITAILCPLLVSWLDKMDRKRAPQDYAAQPAVN